MKSRIINVFALVFISLFFLNCNSTYTQLNLPKVKLSTNLPLANQGVVITNATPEYFFVISKTGRLGKTIAVGTLYSGGKLNPSGGLPPGESIFIPADRFKEKQTFVIRVTAYDKHGQIVGVIADDFRFRNRGTESKNQDWTINARKIEF
ncbi:MAG: hypothetical protein WDZ80_05020 [Candidatus Paceibacterota bacterium]